MKMQHASLTRSKNVKRASGINPMLFCHLSLGRFFYSHSHLQVIRTERDIRHTLLFLDPLSVQNEEQQN